MLAIETIMSDPFIKTSETMSTISETVPKLKAMAGWYWFKTGFKIFKSQPFSIGAAFLFYLLLLMLANAVPYLGFILGCLLWPVLTFGMLKICAEVAVERNAKVTMLFDGFKGDRLQEFLNAGVVYLLLCIIVFVVSLLLFGLILLGAGIPLSELKQFNSNADLLDQLGVAYIFLLGILFLLASLFLSTALWFAPALIGWKSMKAGKAVFYGLYGILRNMGPFCVLCFIWLFFGVILTLLVIGLLSLFTASPVVLFVVMVTVLLPIALMSSVIMMTSLYASYVNIFGLPTVSNSTGLAIDEDDQA